MTKSQTTAFALLVVILTMIEFGESLRTGAPALACISLRPFHGLHRAKPASASQFFVSQSSLTYAPAENITVEVATHSSERYFRGFIVQAYDPISGSQIGSFVSTSEVRPIDSCSAATHRNNVNKKSVLMTWMPPAHQATSSESESAGDSSWLNLRLPVQPHMSFRYSEEERGDNNVEQAASSHTGHSHVHTQTHGRPQQVRFRASIVVTYEEFYTGFESSDRSFDKFDYANGPIQSQPQGIGAPIAAVGAR